MLQKEIYILEGKCSSELVKKIFEVEQFPDPSLVIQVINQKNMLFKEIRRSEPFEGVKEMLEYLKCLKAVVSGSQKNDVDEILIGAFGKQKDLFQVVITADDTKQGKPDPSAFLLALQKLKLKAREAMVVENSPIGVRAANSTGISCLVVLNNTPLSRSDFNGLVPNGRIFENTYSITKLLKSWCEELVV